MRRRRGSAGGIEVRHRTIDADDDPSDRQRVEVEGSDVVVADATLSGAPYRAGTDTHVVHVVEDVMVPVAAGPALRLVRWNNLGVSFGCVSGTMRLWVSAVLTAQGVAQAERPLSRCLG